MYRNCTLTKSPGLQHDPYRDAGGKQRIDANDDHPVYRIDAQGKKEPDPDGEKTDGQCNPAGHYDANVPAVQQKSQQGCKERHDDD